jgi:hypothetical protein
MLPSSGTDQGSGHKGFWTRPHSVFPGRSLGESKVHLLGRVINLAAIVIGLGWLLVQARAQLEIVTQPGPQELNEPAAWYATWLLDHGRNPYILEELPAAAQFFGPFYNYVVIALKPILGIDYTGHRLVNLMCVAAVLWLLISRMRRAGTSLGVTLLSAAVFYWLCVTNIMVTARPDALGLLLFVAAVIIPWERDFRRGPAILGLACAFLAFHCKAYFALAGVTVLLGVAFHRSKREAGWLAAGFFLALAISVAVLDRIYPNYLLEAFVMQYHMVQGNSNDESLAEHTVQLFECAWPWLLLLTFALKDFLLRYDWRANLAFLGKNLLNPGAPLTAQPIPVLGLSLLLHFALIQSVMGRNGGADFTYHLHLLFPFALLLLAGWARTPRRRLVAAALLGVCVQANLYRQNVPDSAPAYAQLEQKLAPCQHVLGIGSATDLLARPSKRMYTDGFTIFFPFAFAASPLTARESTRRLEQHCTDTSREIVDDVVNRRFDLILTTDDWCFFCDMEKIRANYELRDRLDLPMPFTCDHIQFWYPRTPSAAGP